MVKLKPLALSLVIASRLSMREIWEPKILFYSL